MESFVVDSYGSFENLMAEAKNGNVAAQGDLGIAYCEGVGNFLEKDLKEAIGWLNTAVENGCVFPFVIGKLGELFDQKGTPQYQQMAYEMYCKAANLGYVESQFNLAEMYRCGVAGVVNEDIREAFEWYKRAADEKPSDIDSPLHFLLAGTVKKMGSLDEGKANDTKIRALKHLYGNYLEGDCPERRPQPTKAVHYLNKAAELGDTEAQRELGKIYLNGSCEQLRDVRKARRWLGKASAKGDQKAKQHLELCDQTDDTPHKASDVSKRAFKQSLEVELGKLKQDAEAGVHPFAIRQPVLFTEELLNGFQWSPTAGIYHKAYKLVKTGFEILEESDFTDRRGISYIAHGYLTENSISQAFPQWPFLSSYIFQLCDKILQKNPSFLEALVVSIGLQPISKLAAENSKNMLKKIACIKNLIRFIQVAEPNGTPCKDPFEFDKSYSSWLHVLYSHLGSLYKVGGKNDDAAEAWGNSLKCCPSYFESKRSLGFSLLMLYCSKWLNTQKESNELHTPTETIHSIPMRKESIYSSYSAKMLRETVVCLLKEFLQEAPPCYKYYPNVYYYLAYLALKETNMKEFREYYERGQDAEVKRLPFFYPFDLQLKRMMSPFYQLFGNVIPAMCGNRACTKKVKEENLMSCPCGNVKYCSKDCQKADWKIHKISCSTRRNKAKSDTQLC